MTARSGLLIIGSLHLPIGRLTADDNDESDASIESLLALHNNPKITSVSEEWDEDEVDEFLRSELKVKRKNQGV
jgi:hypothetical protein